MVKRYFPYVLIYVLGVASAWGVFQLTLASSRGGTTYRQAGAHRQEGADDDQEAGRQEDAGQEDGRIQLQAVCRGEPR
jgi:hypothetical protein